MNFQESEAYLLSLGNEVETMKLRLENIRKLLAALGDPQKKYKKVQVAGTNGKGSVCAFLDSICREAGIITGLYTSPHLISITERVKIDGVDIYEDEFATFATRIRATAEKLVADGALETIPTFFEQITAIGLMAFAEHKVELAILETGLGGRFDAVTAAEAEIAAITRIDLDHQEYLGETIEEIAAEKAAIINSDTIAFVLGEQEHKEVFDIVREHCKKVGFWKTFDSKNTGPHRWRGLPQLAAKVRTTVTDGIVSFDPFGPIRLGLRGKHQIENAKIAICLIESLIEYADELFGRLLKVEIEDVVRGLENAQHAGRLEQVGNLLLDGAHNPSGANALREYLLAGDHKSITLIFGAMREKAVASIAELLWPNANKIVLTRPSNSRAMSADELAKFAPRSVKSDAIVKTDSVADALKTAQEITPRDGLIVVTGSLYLVGEVKKILQSG